MPPTGVVPSASGSRCIGHSLCPDLMRRRRNSPANAFAAAGVLEFRSAAFRRRLYSVL
jgi:hypothetical protein